MLAEVPVDAGDTAWVMICTGLVLFMVPGLALFYAGMVRSRNTLVMLQQNMIPLGVVSILWILLGYSLAFGGDAGGIIGNLELFGLRGAAADVAPAPAFHVVAQNVTIPTLAFVAYQMMFAVITPALITGATADRLKFAGWVLFIGIWSIVVYAPVAHWLWGPNGWLAELGAQDWAGGMVVHASAGAAVMAVLLVVGRRRDWPKSGTLPHSLPLTIAGAGILWFGWFGFNAGDGLQANGIAAQALLNTHVAAAAGMVLWLLVERIRDGHATALGGVTGAVAGLATITPCAGYVSTLSAIIIGAVAGLVCHMALRLKFVFRFDDALDVLAVHFVGGMLGSLLLGLFGSKTINSAGADGLFFGGGAGLLGDQLLAVVAVVVFAFCLTWLIAIAIQKTIGLRAAPADEHNLDQVQQGMDAYHLDGIRTMAGSGRPHAMAQDAAIVTGPQPSLKRENVRLVTGLLDPELVRADELEQALLEAGASSIVVSEAHLRTRARRPQIFRGFSRELEFSDRLRVEVLVAERNAEAILAAFDRFSSGRRDGFVQVVEPAAIDPGRQA